MSTRNPEPAGASNAPGPSGVLELDQPADVSGLVEVPTVSALTDISFVEEDGTIGAGLLDVAAALVALDSSDARDALSAGELVDLAAAYERLESYAAAAKRRAAAALARRGELREKMIEVRQDTAAKAQGRDVLTSAQTRSFRLSESAKDELSARLGISRPAAARLIAEGQAMEANACLVGEALTNGHISAQKARIVTDALYDQPLETCLAVSEEILPAAPGLQPAELTRQVQRLVIEVDPERAAEQARRARAFRNLSAIQSLPDGLARISITSGRLDVAAFRTAADLAAKAAKAGGDERTMDQLRADAATTFALTAIHHGELPPFASLPGLVPVAPVASVALDDPAPTFSIHPEPPVTLESHVSVEADAVCDDKPAECAAEACTPASCAADDVAAVERAVEGGTSEEGGPDEQGAEGCASEGCASEGCASEGRASEGRASGSPAAPESSGEPAAPPGGASAACLLVTKDDVAALSESAVTVRFDPRGARALIVDESLVVDGADAPLPVGQAQSWADDVDEELAAIDALRRAQAIVLESWVARAEAAALVAVEIDAVGLFDDWSMHAAPSGGPPPPEDAAPESPPPDNLPPDEPPPHLPPRRLGESVPELVGAGPLDHALARELALNPPDWLGVVVLTAEPSADHGADACAGPEDGYLPSAPLRCAVVAAHPTCVGPSCHVPSKECQLDHVIPWPIGRTEAANLRPLCLRCHLLKTHAGHRYAIEPTTGDIVWTTATGHRYRRTTTGVTTHLRRAGHVPPSPARRAGRP